VGRVCQPLLFTYNDALEVESRHTITNKMFFSRHTNKMFLSVEAIVAKRATIQAEAKRYNKTTEGECNGWRIECRKTGIG
jgi:hypothetical protein